MTVTEQIDQKHQDDLKRLRDFRLFDDDFLTKCFEGDTAGMELVLQIVLEKPDLKILDVRTQVFVENLLNRSVRFDILATDSGYGGYEKPDIERGNERGCASYVGGWKICFRGNC